MPIPEVACIITETEAYSDTLTELQYPVTKVSGMATTDIARLCGGSLGCWTEDFSVSDISLTGYLFYTHTEQSATKNQLHLYFWT